MKGKKLLTCFIIAVVCFCLSGLVNYSLASISGHTNNLSEQAIKKKIVKEAKKQDFCPYLALSVARQESEFKCDARSPVGAIGLFQLMPQTAEELNVNPHNVDQNIRGGIKYLKSMKQQFGSTQLALAAYNAGPTAVQRYGTIPPYRETQTYVRNIMNFYNQYKKHSDPVLAEL
ncbi:MAG: hypothetical protein A2Y25_08440 [Candidatus Melainabacteria bacterium GWF2_37_15]|nr:MAG: hypothetical protein A2Y25_08440 [Candidatus Melainabacteria bacterium GWF2_37_15]